MSFRVDPRECNCANDRCCDHGQNQAPEATQCGLIVDRPSAICKRFVTSIGTNKSAITVTGSMTVAITGTIKRRHTDSESALNRAADQKTPRSPARASARQSQETARTNSLFVDTFLRRAWSPSSLFEDV